MIRLAAGLLALSATAAAVARAQSFLPNSPWPAPQAPVHAASSRLLALNAVFLGHWGDALSDALRNPALSGGGRQITLLTDGEIGAWAAHASGRARSIGWQASLITGPASLEPERTNRFASPSLSELVPPAPPYAPALLATSNSRWEGRLGLSVPAGSYRFGVALSAADLPGSERSLASYLSRSTAGDGWGLSAGWFGPFLHAWQGDLAFGWQDGSVRGNLRETRLLLSSRDRQRDGWVRFLIFRGAASRTTLSVLGRRMWVDNGVVQPEYAGARSDSILSTRAITTMLRVTEFEVRASRLWAGRGSQVGMIVGGRYASLRYDSGLERFGVGCTFCTDPPPSYVSQGTRWGPEIGLAAELEVRGFLRLRGSALLRVQRSESDVPCNGSGCFSTGAVIGRATSTDSDTDIRAGLGIAPRGSRLEMDLYTPNFAVPGRWTIAASYRF